ncbi:MAG: fumarylacetoacetate hydrolase [SAR86 cluster bacterium]|uniref:Fumarylacetoacetate hydrolase n=1 Tax=SAR86 cluster bacterium TaxID=2030880 RepID=A0A2A4MV08_9GAMM|nr:MAG: fumarylacetoacetate hydrolase [SAR86 cluster bacterium]
MTYVFPPQPQASLAIDGSSQRFPLHRIYCVGRNYADHVKEMGGDVTRNAPVFFSKPATALVSDNADVAYPQATQDLHHEVELVICLAKGGKNISLEAAQACVFGYSVGIDFTRRDLQSEAKKGGKPWDVAKGFDNSAPVSQITPVDVSKPLSQAQIKLAVNGQQRQCGNIEDMIYSVAEVIMHLSTFFELKAGDLIFTGTPAGVSAVGVGDKIQASIESVGSIEFTIV